MYENQPNLKEFESIIDALRIENFNSLYFRGQANIAWNTRPTLIRTYDGLNVEQLKEKELLELDRMTSEATPKSLFNIIKNDNLRNWHLLMQAQHLGYPTRLLDWTAKWIIGLYFACSDPKQDEFDGVLLYTHTNWNCIMDDNELATIDPFNMNRFIMIWTAVHITEDINQQQGIKRIIRQNGKFLISPMESSIIPLEIEYKDYFSHILIPKEKKKLLREELQSLGINHDSIYNSEWL